MSDNHPPSLPSASPLEVSFEALLEAAPDAMVIVDSGGRILLVNAQTERLFGYTRAEMVGGVIELLVPEGVRGRHVEHRSHYAGHPVARPMGRLELLARRKDGTEFPAEISLSPMQTNHGMLVTSAIRDITERKKAEEERETLVREQAARREAEAANRMKDAFLSVLSHELRTPLNAIVGWGHMLHTGSLDEPMRAKAVEAILRNANAQTQLISDILDLSRITAGKIHLSVRPVVLARVVEAAMETMRPAAEAKQIRVRGEVEPDIQVAGDPDRLQQVVWNLLSNAIKFTPPGGQVTVRLARVETRAELVVEDTGAGIEPDFLPHVFEAFRQADSTNARAHGGLGLGLAIVRDLVALHGGEVSAQSAGLGLGATFKVELPIPPGAGSVAGVAEGGDSASGAGAWAALPKLYGVRVLLVEDEGDGREMVTELLTRVGAEVTHASGAEEALRMLQSDRPDVLVSDIEMPGEDGYSLVRRLRERSPEAGGTVPAVALTAHVRPEDRLKALTSGFQRHVGKPVSPAELLTVIGALVGRIREPGG